MAFWSRLLQDLGFGLRAARRSPTFAVSVVLVSTLAIGATTTIFSVVDGILLRELPYPDADRIVYLERGSHPGPRFLTLEREVSSIDHWAAGWPQDLDLRGQGRPLHLSGAAITPEFFRLFGGRPAAGRLFEPADHAGDAQSVVIADHLWARLFGRDPGAVGRSVDLGGRQYRVIGVLAADFVEPEQLVRRPTDIWLPADLHGAELSNPNFYVLEVAGRLGAGVTVEGARHELDLVSARLAAVDPGSYRERDGRPTPLPIAPLRAATVGDARRPLSLLFGAVTLMLFLASANVIALYLTRATERTRELAVRAALGADRTRLVSQLVAESLTLGLVAGGLGALVAALGIRLLARWYPGDLPRAADVAIDGRVLGFAIGLGLVTGLVFGLVPALLLSDGQLHRASRRGALEGRSPTRLRNALLAVEVAVAVLLLVGSGLLFRSFGQLLLVAPGFRVEGLAIAKIGLKAPYTAERRVAFVRQIIERARAIPGVIDASAGVVAPLARFGGSRCCWAQEQIRREDGTEVRSVTFIHPVAPRYFETIGATLRGAGLGDSDPAAEPYPTVVSDGLAATVAPGASPIGRSFQLGKHAYRVVGVVTGLHQWGLDQAPAQEMFVPYSALGGVFDLLDVVVRTTGDPNPVLPALRQAIWQIDPTLPADELVTVADQLSRSVAGPRFLLRVMGIFAALSLLVAAVGLYASMRYLVERRARELGIRVALGASRAAIVGLVVREAGTLSIAGAAIGAALALGASRVLRSFLFGVGPADPIAYGAAIGFLAMALLAAAWIPARRAAATDPALVLKD